MYKKVSIPNYSLREELINTTSHGIGIIFSLLALFILLMKTNNIKSTISIIIYTITMFIMYLVSFLYHAMPKHSHLKRILRLIDHCDIFLFISGCYTPIALILIGKISGFFLFILSWSLAILGIIVNVKNLDKYKNLSTILYLLMGWMIILSYNTLKKTMPQQGISLLIYGGLSYTFGAVLYMLGSKIKYMHSLFHIFVLIGSILHFFCIYLYVL